MVNREKTLVALAKALCNNIAGAGSTNFFHAKGAKISFTQRAQRDIVHFNSLRTLRNDFASSARTIISSRKERKVFLTRKECKGF